jgi:branched-chain amino acid transport system substrate-binding protein
MRRGKWSRDWNKNVMTEPRRPFLWLFWAVFLLPIFVSGCRNAALACVDPLGCQIVRPNEPYQLVALLPLTGPAAYIGEEAVAAIELAIAARGGLFLEHPLELLVLDSACDPQRAVQILEKELAENPPAALIGPACAQVAEEVAPQLATAGVWLISPLVSVRSAPVEETAVTVFRLAPEHTTQAVVAARFAREELRADQILIIGNEADYSRVLQQRFTQEFTDLGGQVVVQTIGMDFQNGLGPMFELLETAVPDALYLPLLAPEANLLLNELYAADINIPAIGGDALFSAEFARSAGLAAENVYLTYPFFENDVTAQFRATWNNTQPAPPQTIAPPYAFDAVEMLLTAVADVVTVSENSTLIIPRSSLQARLTGGEPFSGLTGTINCDQNGACAPPGSIGIYQISEAAVRGESWPPPRVWPAGDS